MKKLGLLATFVVFLVLGLGFKPMITKAEDKKIQVVTTFYPVYDFTKAIVGDKGDVHLLIGAGTEVHDFEPSTKDIATIQKAHDFVYMDNHLETWVEKVSKSLDTKKMTIIKSSGDILLTKGVKEEDEDHGDHEGHHHDYDPHLWLSPTMAMKLVENIRDGLIASHPEYKDTFTKNAAAYLDKLKTLDKEYKDGLSDAKQKSFVTQHAAFGYLALDYGLKQIPITGVSAESEPTAKRMAELSKYVKKYGIRYIYFEENASQAVAKTLANEAGVKTAVLNPLESLTKKEMAAGEDYFSVMRSNLKALRLTTDKEGKEIPDSATEEKTVEKGYFDDKDIKNRSLSDWTGDWQSVYPYLEDGTLDQVWEYKAKINKDRTAGEYKDYYTKGYQTDVEKITINGKKNTMTFVQNGQKHTYTYKYVGYKVLTYQKGNRGVRYLFETEDKESGQFKYVQFSDHGISSQKAEHFHIYFGGDSQEKLLKQLDNWPTYYPADLSGHEIAQEMVAH